MKHELLVPVGTMESLISAINYGADAIYLGGKKFGARAFASNFSYEELEEATKLCHLYNVKIYVTVNTLVYENEIDEVVDYIRYLHKIGVDALIMQDVGLINLTHQMFPNLEIHASTQMHNHSAESLNFLKNLGVKRVVFARELPLDYINDIETDLEKEVFIHGSLCISYSGQCLFSSRLLGRSGNRGECAGMCRLPYELYEDDKRVKTDGDYLLSPKDLSSIDNFKKLLDSNILCFKIEGRMKSPLYVAYTTKIYRTLIDKYERGEELKINKEDLEDLESIFTRGYTGGFLHQDKDLMNFKSPNHMGLKIGDVVSVNNHKIAIKLTRDLPQFSGVRFKDANIGININFLYDKKDNLINMGKKGDVVYLDNFMNLKDKDEVMLTSPVINLPKEIIKKIPIKMEVRVKVNEPLKIKVRDKENEIELVSEVLVEKAKSAPVTEERIKEALEKVGDTPFVIDELNIDVDDNIFIPIGVINRLRKEVLDNLKELRENKKIDFKEKEFKKEKIVKKMSEGISVHVRTKEQLLTCQKLNIKNIIVDDPKLMSDDLIYRVPRDNMHHNYNYKRLLVTDYASLDKYPHNYGDYPLNVTNHYTLDYLSKYANTITLSVENDMDNIKNIMLNDKNNLNVEVVIYGNIELMIMKYCPLNTIVNKDKICHVCDGRHNYYLKDRNKEKYKLINNPLTHSTVIMDYKKIDLIKDIPSLKKMGIKNFRLELLEENEKEVEEIIERVRMYE